MKRNFLKLSLIALAALAVGCDGNVTSSSSNAPESTTSTGTSTSSSATPESSSLSQSSSSSPESSVQTSTGTTSSATSSTVEEEINYGTESAPLSIAEALELSAKQCANDNDVTQKIVYAKGIVTNQPDYSGSYIKTFYLADSKEGKSLMVYSCNKNDAVANPDMNDEVVVYGFIKNYKGTIEFASANQQNVQLAANTRGTSSINVVGEHVTTEGVPTTGTNGSTFDFTLTAESGYQIDSVKVNGTAINAVEGKYTATVAGDTTIRVSTSAEGTVQPILAGTLSFASDAKRTSQDANSQVWVDNGITFTNSKGSSTTNVANYANPIRCYKGSDIKVEFTGMVKVVFNCDKSDVKYVNALNGSTFSEGVTHTVDESVLTVTFETANVLEIKTLSNQVRITSIEVYTLPKA